MTDSLFIRMKEQIARLTAERDEARREVCYASHLPPRECAEQRGWDCWKDGGK